MRQRESVIVSVVIVNWNAGELLLNCLASLPRALSCCEGACEVIVVDNASSDGSARGLICPGVDLRVIENAQNIGFGAASNQGAAIARGEYLLFLNPDARLFDDTIFRVLSEMRMDRNESVAICGVRLLDESGNVSRGCARFPTPLRFLMHAFGVDRVFPKVGHFMAEWDHLDCREVDHVIGAFYFVRRKVFEALEGFDERFFVYLEDLDFSYRANLAGWRTLYFADAGAFHVGGGTSRRVKARRLFYSLKSRLLFSHKHFSTVGALAVFFATTLFEPLIRLVLCAVRGSWSEARQTCAAYVMLWRWIPMYAFGTTSR